MSYHGGSEAEHSVETANSGTLVERLEAERVRGCLGAAHQNASALAENFLPSIKDVLRDGGRVNRVQVGYSYYAVARLQWRVIGVAAERAGIKLTRLQDGESARHDNKEPEVCLFESKNALEISCNDEGRDLLTAAAEEVEAEIKTPFLEVGQQITAGATKAHTGFQYDLSEPNLDLVLGFLGIDPGSNTPIARASVLAKSLYGGPVHASGYPPPMQSGTGIYLRHDGSVEKILVESDVHPGVYRGVYFKEGSGGHVTTESFALGVEIDEERASLEVNNNKNKSSVAIPFLRGVTGNEFVSAFESVGLEFSDRVLDALVGQDRGGFTTRYGNSFSELSREVAKFVNNPDRSIHNLFVQDGQQAVDALIKVDAAEFSSPATRELMLLLQRTLVREKSAQHVSSVPVHKGEVAMNVGSCKDAEIYFCKSPPASLFLKEGTPMLHKLHGEKTAINLEPIIYKGVELPAGSLFQVHEDGYTFVRFTSFCFDPEVAADAFTWQYGDALEVTGSDPDVRFLEKIRRNLGVLRK